MRTNLWKAAALGLAALALSLALPVGPATAEGFHLQREALSSRGTFQSWMNPEVQSAWNQGFTGRGVTVTVVDWFKRGDSDFGNLGTGQQALRHGQWTREQARMIAPGARVRAHDVFSDNRVKLRKGLNVINLSYGAFAPSNVRTSNIDWGRQEGSIIDYAHRGRAVVAKAAGNDRIAIGSANSSGNVDHLNTALTGARSVLFVGALTRNGTTANPAPLASYSNFAGSDTAVQERFLVVGVEASRTNLAGTSFAAPIVSGYAAILGSKFRKANPRRISDHLLSTARTDTIQGYNRAVHGRGEASLSRALAPRKLK